MVPTGQGPTDHAALKHLDLPPLGWPTRYFILATPGLLLTTGISPTSYIRRDLGYFLGKEALLTAIDLDDGHTIGSIPLPVHASGNPMTYVAQGSQYILIPCGESNGPGQLLAFAVPIPGEKLPQQ